MLALIAAFWLSSCTAKRGPDYGVDPVERNALAIPPDLVAEPVAPKTSLPDSGAAGNVEAGPQASDSSGEWAARKEGNTLIVPVSRDWALGSIRSTLLLKGIDVAEEHEGSTQVSWLRTDWLDSEDLHQLEIPPPEEGKIRYLLECRSLSQKETQVFVQAKVWSGGEEVIQAQAAHVERFLTLLQPAFGKLRGGPTTHTQNGG